eukprot:TRINITY_DN6019_c0_g1_i1.p1 TRINITY_DN6019_c0_g1~~TRINITY_DN6019_c0_g1_i1.p1  ORF type:complete len:382 (+),score=40.61 TRINITY_DN6019_c0_g1_i1:67-1212(+)
MPIPRLPACAGTVASRRCLSFTRSGLVLSVPLRVGLRSCSTAHPQPHVHIRQRDGTLDATPAPAPNPSYFCKSEKARPGQWAKPYLQLGKHRLTALVVATAIAGYYVAGGALLAPEFPALLIGTTLQSLSANGYNQVMERTHDARMKRTMLRPVVTGDLTVPRALLVSTAELGLGTLLLYSCTNPLTAALGLTTHLLYVLCYTPMKRWHWLNTWVGAVVGALPPVMGCAAATGVAGASGLFLGGLLFLWQMPHFLALSYLCRRDYAHAGFRMLASEDPQRAASYSLDHALILSIWCLPCAAYAGFGFPFLGGCLALNTGMVYLAQQYHTAPGIVTARNLFRYSILFLTLALILAAWDRPELLEAPAAAVASEQPPAAAVLN